MSSPKLFYLESST